MHILRLVISIVFAAALSQSTSAQGFIEQLTATKAGQGKVTVTQDQRLTDIINGNGKHSSGSTSTGVGVVTPQQDKPTSTTQTNLPATGKKVKVRGYRIQIYWGGSQRVDQSKAQQMAARSGALFPELQTYTSFDSPHWRCRVGDFVEREDAVEYLRKIREARICDDAMIVRSEVYVYQ